MNILAIDYGLRKVGVALSMDSPLAEPLDTLKRKSDGELIKSICLLIDRHEIDLVIVGLPRGPMKDKIIKFADELGKTDNLHVKLWSEELTTQQVQFQSRQVGKSRVKLEQKEHEWAAANILQSYLDENV